MSGELAGARSMRTSWRRATRVRRCACWRARSAVAPDPRLSAAVCALRAARGALPIPALAKRVGLGERQLERLFAERVGYGPKFLARVVRMEQVTRAVDAGRGSIASWARL